MHVGKTGGEYRYGRIRPSACTAHNKCTSSYECYFCLHHFHLTVDVQCAAAITECHYATLRHAGVPNLSISDAQSVASKRVETPWLDVAYRSYERELWRPLESRLRTRSTQSAHGAVEGACGYLRDVKSGGNAARIALGAGDAGVMDAGEWVVLCG